MTRIIPALITAGCLVYAAVTFWKRLELQPWQQTALLQLAGIVGVLVLTAAAGVAYVVATVIETWKEYWDDED